MNKVSSNYRCNSIRGVLCALLIGTIAPVFSQWEPMPSGTTSYLKDIFFLNDSVGYCVGGGDSYGFPNAEQAVVLRSMDGGATWSTVLQDTGVAFTEVTAKGDTVVCFGRSMAATGLLWSSFNNGNSWAADTLTWLFENARNPVFYGPDIILLSGQDLLKLDLDTHVPETLFVANNASLFDMDGSSIYLLSMERHLFRSTDGGSNWGPIPCLFDSLGPWQGDIMQTLYSTGDTILITVGYNPATVYTTDLGLNWTWYEGTSGPNAVFTSLDTIYIYVNSETIIVSTDRGVSSQVQQTLPFTIGKVFFLPDTDHGWACGENGMIYKTTNGGFSTGVAERPSRSGHITVQPNPAHGEVTLVVPDGIQVKSIELLDSTLKRVRLYQSSVRVLNTEGLAHEQYLLQVITDQGTQSIKVVLQ